MTWREAIDDLEAQTEAWTPSRISVASRTWSEDASVNVLVFEREDGRRVTLEPAVWKKDAIPTAADLYSSRGTRVRLQGPDSEGRWRILTSDLLPLRIAWDAEGFQGLLDDLLNV